MFASTSCLEGCCGYISLSVRICRYDCLGAFAGEVSTPGKTFPTAMIITMVLTNVIDFLAVLVGMSCVQDYESWSDGTFEKVASFIGGRTFGKLLIH